MKRYNKIVRDNIPQIIQNSGKQYSIETVTDKEAIKFLIDKLFEEATELKKKFCAEEIADIQEVLNAIINKSPWNKSEIDDIRKEKHKERGGFDQDVILKLVK